MTTTDPRVVAYESSVKALRDMGKLVAESDGDASTRWFMYMMTALLHSVQAAIPADIYLGYADLVRERVRKRERALAEVGKILSSTPLGEYPDLPVVPGVEPRPPAGSTGPLTDRIEKVLAAHRLAPALSVIRCRCGHRFDSLTAHRRHVAQLVAEEISAT